MTSMQSLVSPAIEYRAYPRNWLVAVGANQYRNLRDLNYAERDSAAIVQLFSQELETPLAQIYHFSDHAAPIPQNHGPSLEARPTFSGLRRFLRVRFEHPFLQAGDTLWFFFAGHGCRYQDRDYLLPMDADPGDIANTAIPLYYVAERLRRSGADNIILLIDACRSNGDRTLGSFGQERVPGVITLFSCSPQEASYEVDALGQGLFTHVLLEALHPTRGENCATVERLYHHLCQRVPELSDRHGLPRQHPHGSIEPPTQLHRILLPHQARPGDLKALKFQATLAELKQDYGLARRCWIQVLTVAPGDADGIEGIERLAQHSNGADCPASAQSQRTTEPPPVPQAFAQPPTAQPSPVKSPMSDRPILNLSTLATVAVPCITVDSYGQVIAEQERVCKRWVEPLGDGSDPSLALSLMVIPKGIFTSGWHPDPQGIAPFLMGQYPITQAQWRFVSALPRVVIPLSAEPSYFAGDDRPVEQVSWQEAQEFCARLSLYTGHTYQLPTEAQWEYACRAGTRGPFHFGDTLTTDLANYRGTDSQFGLGNYNRGPKGIFLGETTPVGHYPSANPFGLYDLHGNVWEWCQDEWVPEREDLSGELQLQPPDEPEYVLRGGSWFFQPRHCRSSHRNRSRGNYRLNSIGFRVVCIPPWATPCLGYPSTLLSNRVSELSG